jgi:hypothetical protein
MNFHEGKKPFLCTIEGCGKSFFERGNLKYHEKKFHKEELESLPFACKHTKCNLKFKTKKQKLEHHHEKEKDCEREKVELIELMDSYREMINYLLNYMPDEQIEFYKEQLLALSKHHDIVIQEF